MREIKQTFGKYALFVILTIFQLKEKKNSVFQTRATFDFF